MDRHEEANGAYNPALLTLDRTMLRTLHPEFFGLAGCFGWAMQKALLRPSVLAVLARHLSIGDTRAAVVIKLTPLLIAAYTDELDAVAVMRAHPLCDPLVPKQIGARLLTVNTYWQDGDSHSDILDGPRSTQVWRTFHPIIPQFVSRDAERMRMLAGAIDEDEWERTEQLGRAWIDAFGAARARDSRPGWSGVPIEEVRP